MAVDPIPEGYTGAIPYLIVEGAEKAIRFYEAAFGGKELFRLDGPDGTVMHAEVGLAGGRIMLSEANPGYLAHSPGHYGGSPVSLCIFVEDVDAVFARALAAGATEVRPVADQFYGDRMGTLRDPFGHVWSLGTHIEDVTPEEMQRRMAAMGGGEGGGD